MVEQVRVGERMVMKGGGRVADSERGKGGWDAHLTTSAEQGAGASVEASSENEVVCGKANFKGIWRPNPLI
jgi:hypothetical protein